jgi:hypothetical protein
LSPRTKKNIKNKIQNKNKKILTKKYNSEKMMPECSKNGQKLVEEV